MIPRITVNTADAPAVGLDGPSVVELAAGVDAVEQGFDATRDAADLDAIRRNVGLAVLAHGPTRELRALGRRLAALPSGARSTRTAAPAAPARTPTDRLAAAKAELEIVQRENARHRAHDAAVAHSGMSRADYDDALAAYDAMHAAADTERRGALIPTLTRKSK